MKIKILIPTTPLFWSLLKAKQSREFVKEPFAFHTQAAKDFLITRSGVCGKSTNYLATSSEENSTRVM